MTLSLFTRKTYALAALAMLVCACSADKAPVNPRSAESVSVLEPSLNYQVDESASGFGFEIPEPFVNPLWAQVGGGTSHAPGNPALSMVPKKVWSSDIGVGSGKNAKLLASPVIAEGKVFAQDAEGYVSAYALDDGDRIWRVKTSPKNADDSSMGGGIAWEQGAVFAATGFGEVLSLRASDGGIVWRQSLGKPLRAAPVVAEGRVFVVTVENETHVLDSLSGRPLWRHTGISESAALLGSSSPAVRGDTVVIPYSSGEIFGLRTQNGRLAWSEILAVPRRVGALPAIADIRGLPVMDGKQVFAISHSGRLAAIDERTGDRIWERDIGGINTPCVVGQAVFVVTNDNKLIALTRQQGRILWVTELREREKLSDRSSKSVSWFGPVLAGGRLWLVNSMGVLAAYAPETGYALVEQEVADAFYLPPVVANKTMVLLGDDGKLHALR